MRIKRLVCFGEKTKIRLKQIIENASLGKRRKKCSRKAKEFQNPHKIKIHTGKKRDGGYFRIDGIRVSSWWERENWAMITDPENPFGDITREDELKVKEILKGMW